MRILHFTPRHWLAAILLLALAIGVYRLVSVPPKLENGQTDKYWPLVNNLLDGKGYSLCYPFYFPFCGTHYQATALREPVPTMLFAAVAAVTGRSLEAALILQLVMHLVVLLLSYRWVKNWAGERSALIAATLWAGYLPAIQVIPQVSGDLIGAALFLAGAIALQEALRADHWKQWAATGALLALAALSRSVLMFTVLPWGVMALWQRRDRSWASITALRSGAALAGAMALVMSPWIVRNGIVFDRFWPGTSMNGYNLFRNSYQVLDHQPPHYVGPPEAQRMLDDLLLRRTDLRGDENEAEMDRVYMEEGKRALRANPAGFVKLMAFRAIPLLTNLGVPEQFGRPLTLFDHLIFWQQVILLGLMLIGWRVAGLQARLWMATIGLQVAIYMAVVGQVRYLLPVMPMVIGLAAMGIGRLAGTVPSGGRS